MTPGHGPEPATTAAIRTRFRVSRLIEEIRGKLDDLEAELDASLPGAADTPRSFAPAARPNPDDRP